MASVDERLALEREWFYPLTLPSGAALPSTHGGTLDAIHATRLQMMNAALDARFPSGVAERRAVDLACHQGWFSYQLAQRGFAEIVGIDARANHVEDAELLHRAMGVANFRAIQSDIHAADQLKLEPFDVVLCFGLIYHLENPIGALRQARALCRGTCLIETQIVPGMSGSVDWGSYEFVRPLKGVFGIIDEMAETHAPEASVTGICLAPSLNGLLWILEQLGFRRCEVLPVPADGYEQLRHGKRVMVAADL
jgi:tRNA (mo5U34)-methyltransferase